MPTWLTGRAFNILVPWAPKERTHRRKGGHVAFLCCQHEHGKYEGSSYEHFNKNALGDTRAFAKKRASRGQ